MPYQLGDEAILGAEGRRLCVNTVTTNNQTDDWKDCPSQKYALTDALYGETGSSESVFLT